MSSPFSSFQVSPAYGTAQVAISYTLKSGLEGDVYVYRSENGVKGWQILNPSDPISAASGDFIDTAVPRDKLLAAFHWRGMLEEADGTRHGGEPVTAYEALTRSQYATVRKMILLEWRGMARGKGSGTPVFHCIPREFGTASGHVDLETGDRLGPECPEDPADSMGQTYQGGFHTPVKTWVRVLAMGDEIEKTKDDGTGAVERADLLLRMLAFPKPRRGHVIVMPETDDRYVILDTVKRFFFRGIVPLAWHATAKLLVRTDPRYRLEMPDA